MLTLIGREKDAKEVAKKWVSDYELDNGLREPTPEEKKAMEEEKERSYRELKAKLDILKYGEKKEEKEEDPDSELGKLKAALEKAKNMPVG